MNFPSPRTFFFRLWVGGYWASDGSYNGGRTKCCRVDFRRPTLEMLKDVVLTNDYAENMCKFSYFPRRAIGADRVDLISDSDVENMIRGSDEVDSMNVYVVREDDPCLDDVLVGNLDAEEEEEESEEESCDFYKNDYVESDGSDDDEDHRVEFYVRQQFVSKEKCRETIQKYAIKEKVNIHFQKSEKKKIAAICGQENCKWRLYASINSQSDKTVIRSLIGTHSCYPIGDVDLYSAPKIAADFLNEFRQNPKLSAELIMQRLALVGLRVTKTKCQSAREILKHIINDGMRSRLQDCMIMLRS
ncbi:hypothetical protein Bca4012_018500 [Brassica carinata]